MPIIVHDYRAPQSVVASFTHGLCDSCTAQPKLGATAMQETLPVLGLGIAVLALSVWIATR